MPFRKFIRSKVRVMTIVLIFSQILSNIKN